METICARLSAEPVFYGCIGSALVFAMILAIWALNRQAYNRGLIAAENRMLKGIIGETIVGNVDTAIGRDPGHHGL
jgi:hypothetical protein